MGKLSHKYFGEERTAESSDGYTLKRRGLDLALLLVSSLINDELTILIGNVHATSQRANLSSSPLSVPIYNYLIRARHLRNRKFVELPILFSYLCYLTSLWKKNSHMYPENFSCCSKYCCCPICLWKEV